MIVHNPRIELLHKKKKRKIIIIHAFIHEFNMFSRKFHSCAECVSIFLNNCNCCFFIIRIFINNLYVSVIKDIVVSAINDNNF